MDAWRAVLGHRSFPYENEYLSVSRLKVYEQCNKRFWFSYVTQAPRTTSVPADFGKLCHAVLQGLYEWVMEEEFTGIIPESKLIEIYRELWSTQHRFTDEGTEELRGEALYAEGLRMCRDYLNGHPDVDHWNILGVELPFDIEIDGQRLFGFIDRVDKIDDETIEIIDYKTNRMLFEREELEHDIQVSIYALVAERLWPWAKKVRFKFEMIRHGVAQEATRTRDDITATRRYLVDTAKLMEQTPRKWSGTTSVLCGWCNHRTDCSEYQDALVNGAGEMATPEMLYEISQERERLQQILAPLKKHKEMLDKVLTAELASQDRLNLGEYSYRMIHIPRKFYPDADEIVDVLVRYSGLSKKDVSDRVRPVDKKAVDKLLDQIRDDMGDDKDARSRKAMLNLEVSTLQESEHAFSRIHSSLNKRALPGGKAGSNQIEDNRRAKLLPEKEWRDDVECGFCQATPAKLVERGGERFAVCKDHARKRKPPAK